MSPGPPKKKYRRSPTPKSESEAGVYKVPYNLIIFSNHRMISPLPILTTWHSSQPAAILGTWYCFPFFHVIFLPNGHDIPFPSSQLDILPQQLQGTLSTPDFRTRKTLLLMFPFERGGGRNWWSSGEFSKYRLYFLRIPVFLFRFSIQNMIKVPNELLWMRWGRISYSKLALKNYLL